MVPATTPVTTLEHTVLTIWHHVPITCPVGKLLSKHLHLCNDFVCESDAIAWPSVATVYQSDTHRLTFCRNRTCFVCWLAVDQFLVVKFKFLYLHAPPASISGQCDTCITNNIMGKVQNTCNITLWPTYATDQNNLESSVVKDNIFENCIFETYYS